MRSENVDDGGDSPYGAMVRQYSWQLMFTVGQGMGTLRPLMLISPIIAETIAGWGWSRQDLKRHQSGNDDDDGDDRCKDGPVYEKSGHGNLLRNTKLLPPLTGEGGLTSPCRFAASPAHPGGP